MAKHSVAFSGQNVEAQRAAAKRLWDLKEVRIITAIAQETEAAIRTVVKRSIQEGIAPYDTAKLVRTMVGLNERQAQAVMNYRTSLVESGLPDDRVEVLAERYAAKQLRRRSETIARTETMGALNAGMVSAWEEAQAAGYLGPDAVKEWSAVDTACPDLCQPLDGERVPISADFPEGDPPLHPNCRCSLVVIPG